jgi:translation initiation factor 3 subunit L
MFVPMYSVSLHIVTALSPIVCRVSPADVVFLALYKQLYFRHIFVKLRPSLKDRFDSFANYADLFEAVLRQPDAPRAADFELPAQWAWDMVDEYVYQFENFCQYRDHCENLSADEVQQLKANADAWSAPRVLHYLNALVAKSKIRVVKPTEEEEAAPGLLRLMGYFASIALMRVHFLLGDFASALRALEPINFRKKAAWLRVPGCHVTTYYYLGFSYLLMHRYVDVIKIFSNILSYLARARQSGRTHFSSSVRVSRSLSLSLSLSLFISLRSLSLIPRVFHCLLQ